eukprot:c10988_g1_i4.p2 GENE.c10988_g1_i4~~c10988_g1_i4.p2  ORF type:complete len:180 (+),score=39.80 c10988_g1_i4:409-948(+)
MCKTFRLWSLEIWKTYEPRLTTNACLSLRAILLSSTRITCLTLHNCIDDDVAWVVQVLTHLTQLSLLSLADNEFESFKMTQVSAGLSNKLKLTSLNLEYNRMQAEGVRSISHHICNMPQLTSLNLDGNSIREGGVECVIGMLRNAHRLTELKLACETVFLFWVFVSYFGLNIMISPIEK